MARDLLRDRRSRRIAAMTKYAWRTSRNVTIHTQCLSISTPGRRGVIRLEASASRRYFADEEAMGRTRGEQAVDGKRCISAGASGAGSLIAGSKQVGSAGLTEVAQWIFGGLRRVS